MLERMKANFERQKISVKYFSNHKELVDYTLAIIEESSDVGICRTSYLEKFYHNNNELPWLDDGEIEEWKLDHYFISVNAVSTEGGIINADEHGEKIQALTYGPKKVHVIVDEKSIYTREIDAIRYILKHSPPKAVIEAGLIPPCLHTDICHQCSPLTSSCNYVPICRGQHIEDRLEILCITNNLL